MAITWTTEQVLALAPDAASAKAGKDLAAQRKKWVTLGLDDQAAWGECQGSGSKPYQTKIDLSEPAFSCSCPSRKFPCKHGLGLFLMLAQLPSAFASGSPPAWVADWLASRAKKAEDKAKKAEQTQQAATDPEQAKKQAQQQAKRASERKAKVDAGLNDLDRWLGDLVRRGLAAARSEPYSFWEWPAARLVDAQAPGLARQVRDLVGVCTSGDGWQDRLLERLGRLHLLVEGYHRLDTMPPDVQAEIRSQVGWTQSQEELLSAEGVRDRWVVLGQRVEEEDRLRVQRRWLWGETTGRAALVLHFAHATQPLDTSLVTGTVLDADLVFFPASYPLRALVKARHAAPEPIGQLPGFATVDDAMSGYAAAIASNPWIERFPISLRGIIPVRRGETWSVLDESGDGMPLQCSDENGWVLTAMGGGRPVGLFGEWNGDVLIPLGAWAEGRFLPMA